MVFAVCIPKNVRLSLQVVSIHKNLCFFPKLWVRVLLRTPPWCESDSRLGLCRLSVTFAVNALYEQDRVRVSAIPKHANYQGQNGQNKSSVILIAMSVFLFLLCVFSNTLGSALDHRGSDRPIQHRDPPHRHAGRPFHYLVQIEGTMDTPLPLRPTQLATDNHS